MKLTTNFTLCARDKKILFRILRRILRREPDVKDLKAALNVYTTRLVCRDLAVETLMVQRRRRHSWFNDEGDTGD